MSDGELLRQRRLRVNVIGSVLYMEPDGRVKSGRNQ